MTTVDTAKIFFLDGLKYLDAGDFKNAEASFRSCLQILPRSVPTLNNLAAAQFQQRKYAQSRNSAEMAIAIDDKNVDALQLMANCLAAEENFDQAVAICDRIIAIDPKISDVHCNRGLALNRLKRYDEALSSYDRAIELEPNAAKAHLGRGITLNYLRRFDDAIASFELALRSAPNLAPARLGLANALFMLRRYEDASAAYDKALAANPNLAEAWLGRGNVLASLKRYDEALSAYDKATALRPDLTSAWLGRAKVSLDLKRYDEGFAAYDKALELKPDLDDARAIRLHNRMYVCDWRDFSAECEKLIRSVDEGLVTAPPFTFLSIESSPSQQLKCAASYCKKNFPASVPAGRQGGKPYNHSRIRLGYFSNEFYQHAISYLSAGLFEHHDRSRFEVIGYSFGPDTSDPMRKRTEAAFDTFVEIGSLSDRDVARLAQSHEIDIAVDLKGLTQDARAEIFSLRAAPIQVNFLGYPGTMGVDYMDYLIADRTLIPESHQQFYAEKIAYLPHSYQINDSKRAIANKVFTRTEAGLPPDGFVFCCFNNNYKILPHVFDCWMRILGQVDRSVLWLFEDNALSRSNLMKEARARGIDPDRLIFATRMPLPEHLARQRLADLFLDTLPYNAHTTGSDALWAGLPILTRTGETFAARVAASLLNAVGLPELIATTPAAYEAMAVELATHPAKLSRIRQKLADNRPSAPLFDTALFTRHIEAAFTTMHQRHQAGIPPSHIDVPR